MVPESADSRAWAAGCGRRPAGRRPGDSRAWVAGLPLAGTRPLTEEERQFLARMMRQWTGRALLAGGALLANTLFVVVTAVLYWRDPERINIAFGGLVVLTVLAASLPLPIRDWRRNARGCRDALRAGYVLRFEGVLAREFPADEALLALIRRGAISARDDESPPAAETDTADAALAGSDKVQSLELAPESGMALWANGKWVGNAGIFCEIGEVAVTPEHARIAAEWVEPAGEGELADLLFNHRALTPSEIAELEGHIRTLRWRHFGWGFLFNLWALAAVIAWIAHGARLATGDFVRAAVLAVSSVVMDFYYLQRWRLAGRLRADIAVGEVAIVRTRERGEVGEETLSPPHEVLVVSGMRWTEAGEPSSWRRHGRRWV